MTYRRSPAPTITDVAGHAGVSMKTVSRVLNGEPNVVPALRERVMASVAALNYRPNVNARSLAGARSYLLGLLYYTSSAAFVVGLQRGATQRCRQRGYHLVVEPLEEGAADLAQQLTQMMAALRPDGMILAPPVSDNAEVLRILAAAGMPCVLISPGAPDPAHGRVSMDDTRAAHEMTDYLLGLGHRRIGFIGGPPDQAASPRRQAGYTAALAAHGVPADPALVAQGDFTFRTGHEACDVLLALPEPPTAIFAANDDMAMGAAMAVQRRGLQVPAQMSIAGFDDSPVASLAWPQLTTVRQPVVEMAEMAVDLLVARPGAALSAGPSAGLSVGLSASPSGSQPFTQSASTWAVLPHALVLRESTAPPAAALPDAVTP